MDFEHLQLLEKEAYALIRERSPTVKRSKFLRFLEERIVEMLRGIDLFDIVLRGVVSVRLEDLGVLGLLRHRCHSRKSERSFETKKKHVNSETKNIM